MAKILIALGADVNYINKKNSTPYDTANMMMNRNAMELLKSVGGLPANDLISTKSTSPVESDDEMRSFCKWCSLLCMTCYEVCYCSSFRST